MLEALTFLKFPFIFERNCTCYADILLLVMCLCPIYCMQGFYGGLLYVCTKHRVGKSNLVNNIYRVKYFFFSFFFC